MLKMQTVINVLRITLLRHQSQLWMFSSSRAKQSRDGNWRQTPRHYFADDDFTLRKAKCLFLLGRIQSKRDGVLGVLASAALASKAAKEMQRNQSLHPRAGK